MTEILPHSGIMDKGAHIFPFRVYYEDTDVGGVVYYANYLKFMERARSEMISMLGLDQAKMLHYNNADDVSFVVRHIEVDFMSPARFDDCLIVVTTILKLGGASIIMKQDIMKDDKCLIKAIVKIAVIGENSRPKKLPLTIKNKFKECI